MLSIGANRNKLQWILKQITKIVSKEIAVENVVFQMAAIFIQITIYTVYRIDTKHHSAMHIATVPQSPN